MSEICTAKDGTAQGKSEGPHEALCRTCDNTGTVEAQIGHYMDCEGEWHDWPGGGPIFEVPCPECKEK